MCRGHLCAVAAHGSDARRPSFAVRAVDDERAARARLHAPTPPTGRIDGAADADGEGGQVALASNEPIISPAWSPDGKELAYVSFETQKAVVWVQDVSTGRRTQVANFPGTNSAPVHVSHAKLAATDAAFLAAETAVQIHGAMGYTYEVDLHFWAKRSWALAGAWGRVTQRMLIG